VLGLAKTSSIGFSPASISAGGRACPGCADELAHGRTLVKIPAETALFCAEVEIAGLDGLDGGVRSRMRTGLRHETRVLRELTGQNRESWVFEPVINDSNPIFTRHF
jgi:hypothetical protein